MSPGQSVLYFLVDRPRRSFVRDELQIDPEETEFSPDRGGS